jgi:hypothetical protein
MTPTFSVVQDPLPEGNNDNPFLRIARTLNLGRAAMLIFFINMRDDIDWIFKRITCLDGETLESLNFAKIDAEEEAEFIKLFGEAGGKKIADLYNKFVDGLETIPDPQKLCKACGCKKRLQDLKWFVPDWLQEDK